MITLARIREVLQAKPEDDAEVEIIRSQVLALWDTITHRQWSFQAGIVETHVRDYEDQDYLYLKVWPITALTQVRTKSFSSSTWTVLTNVVLITDNEIHNYGGSFSDQIEVTYSAGNVTAPADIAQALEIQAKFITERTSAGKLSVRSQNFEGGGGVYEEAYVHPFMKQLAKKYLRRV